MATIDINTTQNVSIEYELAGLRDRFLAMFIDWMIMGVLVSVVTTVVLTILPSGDGFEDLGLYIVVPFLMFYTLVSEILMDGQTLGKKALGIKVIKQSGTSPSIIDFFLRWVLRPIDIYFSAGVLGGILISSTPSKQRLGGLASNTAIIKTKFNLRFTLNDILKINSLENYEPIYPEVRQLSEKDMLLVKSVISRTQRYKNDAHYEALNLLVKRIREELDIQERPKNKIKFLKTLLRDYIVLTR